MHSRGEEKRGAQRRGSTIEKQKTDGQIWNILSFVGMNVFPALCVDVGERREKLINCVYVLVHVVGENQVEARQYWSPCGVE